MKLRNRKSYITSLPEGAPPRNIRPRITQLIYYAILVFVVGYILYVFGSRFFYFKAPGFVEVEKTIISASHGGRVLKLPIKEEQKVKAKELIAVIAATKSCASAGNSQVIKLKYELDFNRTKLSLLKRAIKDIKNRLSNFNLQRALETGQARESTGQKLKLELIKKQNDADLLEGQIILQQQQINKMKPYRSAAIVSSECYNESIFSPYAGTVRSIKRNLNEFAARGVPLIILSADNAKVRIETYLKNKELSYLHKGDTVDVSFADGNKSEAKIIAIYSSAYNVSEREWDRPAETQVRVHLEPLTKQDAALWRKYDRMEVTVRGRK
ncbi:hypothetical protein MNBD_GAMMA23-2176 [hydrothermal vent metagenome]|uniref:RND efflux pump membrane fusion protein barrel-sandwich domain-containing protein n=1 Tax=hydrothermal vent metagenome TaxID=652676 RepID=A0A3B1A3F0_9ZZZZ